MSDAERDLDESFRAVVRAAVRDAPMGVDVQLDRGPSRSRRGWLVAAAAVVVLAVGVTAIALARRGPSTTVVPDTTPSAATSSVPTSSSAAPGARSAWEGCSPAGVVPAVAEKVGLLDLDADGNDESTLWVTDPGPDAHVVISTAAGRIANAMVGTDLFSPSVLAVVDLDGDGLAEVVLGGVGNTARGAVVLSPRDCSFGAVPGVAEDPFILLVGVGGNSCAPTGCAVGNRCEQSSSGVILEHTQTAPVADQQAGGTGVPAVALTTETLELRGGKMITLGTETVTFPSMADLPGQYPSMADSDLVRCPSEVSGSIDQTTTTSTSVAHLSLPGIIPTHGIAYRTASGTVIATVTGDVLFTIPGVHVVDRSRDPSTMAAVVALDTDTATPPQGFSLDIGASTMREVGPATDTISYAYGWIADGAPSGCLRDARRQQSTLLLCSSDPTSGPDQIARITTDGASTEMIPVSPVQQLGHWVDAVAGPDGYIAATWSGECENLSAFLITPDNRTIPLSDSGASAVQGWVDGSVLVSRFGECGTNSTDTKLFLVTPTGAESPIPTPGAIDTPVLW